LRRVPAPRMNLPSNPWEGEAPAEPDNLGRARLPPSRPTPWEGEAPAEPRVETNGCYCGVWVDLFHHGIHGIHGKTKGRRRDCRALCVCRLWLSMSGAGLGGARLPRSRGIQRLDRGSAQQKLPPPKRQAFGSAGASPSQRQCSAQQELPPPKGATTWQGNLQVRT